MSELSDAGTKVNVEKSDVAELPSISGAAVSTITSLPIASLPTRRNELPDKLYLASDEHDGKRIHRLIEYWLFFKTSEFKNNPRANSMLIRSLKSVAMVTFLCCLISAVLYVVQFAIAWLGSEFFAVQEKPQLSSLLRFGNAIKFVLTFVGAVSFLFWRSSDLFRQQWNYCSNLYNETIKITCPKRAAALRASLAIDLIIVDLWAHRSFQGLFRTELWKAILDKNTHEPGRLSEVVGSIKEGKFTESQARRLLEDYQAKLIHADL